MITFNVTVDNLFVEAQATNPDFSAELDVSEFVGNVFLNVACNATGTDLPAITVEHSATGGGSDFTAVPASALFNVDTGDADTFTTPTASTAQDETLGLVRQQLKRYVRVVLTGAVSSARNFSITAVGQPQYTDG
jgi:hypothetical protein